MEFDIQVFRHRAVIKLVDLIYVTMAMFIPGSCTSRTHSQHSPFSSNTRIQILEREKMPSHSKLSLEQSITFIAMRCVIQGLLTKHCRGAILIFRIRDDGQQNIL